MESSIFCKLYICDLLKLEYICNELELKYPMPSTDDLITELEQVVEKLLQEKRKLSSDLEQIKSANKVLQSHLDQHVKDIKDLQNKNKEMKVVSGLNGSIEHKRLMKHKLNSLIKEVDLCIAEVKNKTI